MHYEAFMFVRAIQGRHWLGMLTAIDSAVVRSERMASQRETPSQRGQRIEFLRFLLAARAYLLSEGRLRPEGISDDEFFLLRPLCQQLVTQGRFAYDCLQLFTVPPPPSPTPADPHASPRPSSTFCLRA